MNILLVLWQFYKCEENLFVFKYPKCLVREGRIIQHLNENKDSEYIMKKGIIGNFNWFSLSHYRTEASSYNFDVDAINVQVLRDYVASLKSMKRQPQYQKWKEKQIAPSGNLLPKMSILILWGNLKPISLYGLKVWFEHIRRRTRKSWDIKPNKNLTSQNAYTRTHDKQADSTF